MDMVKINSNIKLRANAIAGLLDIREDADQDFITVATEDRLIYNLCGSKRKPRTLVFTNMNIVFMTDVAIETIEKHLAACESQCGLMESEAEK